VQEAERKREKQEVMRRQLVEANNMQIQLKVRLSTSIIKTLLCNIHSLLLAPPPSPQPPQLHEFQMCLYNVGKVSLYCTICELFHSPNKFHRRHPLSFGR